MRVKVKMTMREEMIVGEEKLAKQVRLIPTMDIQLQDQDRKKVRAALETAFGKKKGMVRFRARRA